MVTGPGKIKNESNGCVEGMIIGTDVRKIKG